VPRYLKLSAATATLLLLYLAWKYVVPEIMVIIKFIFVLLTPFILAVILAVIIEPFVKFLNEKARLIRPLAIGVAIIVLVGGIGSLLTVLIFRLVKELSDLSVSLPKYVNPVQDYINHLIEQGKIFYFQLPPAVTDSFQERVGDITGWLSDLASSLANSLLHIVTALPGAVMIAVVALIATFFISRDKKVIVQFWLKYIPAPWGTRTITMSREAINAFLGYLKAQFVLISLTTIQSIVGLQLIGADYALTMGLLIGFFDLIPVLGPASIYLPWAIWSFISGHTSFAIKLLFIYALVWGVRQVLEARVVAQSLGLHPLAVLLAMYAGLKALGTAGLIAGPILLIVIQAAVKVYFTSRDK